MRERDRRRRPRRHENDVPVKVVQDLVREAIETEGQTVFAFRCGLDPRRMRSITLGEQEWVTLGVVDRIVTDGLGDPGLWHTHPELSKI